MPKDGRTVSRVTATLAAAVLGITGVVALGTAMASQDPAPPTAPATLAGGGQPRASAARPSEDRPQRRPEDRTTPSLALAESRPVRLEIKSIGVSAGFVDLGVADDGTLEVPEEGASVGWFTGGHTPGASGVAVVAGHVTWDDAPSVFFELGDLRPYDRVRVRRADGSTAIFAVQRIARFPKTDFPSKAVYSPVDRPVLRLITCGGTFDESTGHYVDNVIVWAKLVGVSQAEQQPAIAGTS